MDIATLRTQYADCLKAAKTLADSAGINPISKELGDQINSHLAKADEIKAQIEQLRRLEDGQRWLSEPDNPTAAPLGWRQAGPTEGDPAVDTKAFREFSLGVMTPRGIETKTFRYHVPLVVQTKGYPGAFEAYLRKGFGLLGPTDRKTLIEATDSAGGYLVPEDYQSNILKKIATVATLRQYARVVTTSRDVVKWPRVKYSTNNEYTSGVRVTWTGETPSSSTAHAVTDQVFGEFSIPVGTCMASQKISMDLIDDAAFDVLGISSDLFAEAFGLDENDAFWNGSGAVQPRGVLSDIGDSTDFNAALTKADAANAIASEDILDTYYALPAQYERNARWFMTKATAKYIRKLVDTYDQPIWPVVSQVGELGAPPASMHGAPVVFDEFMDEISSASDTPSYPLIFGDMNAYAIVDRAGLSVKRDDNMYAETNQVLLLGKKRVGGQLVESYRLSALKTGNSTEA